MTKADIVKQHIQSNPGMSVQELATELGMNVNTVRGTVGKLKRDGVITADSVKGKGSAKTPTKKTPTKKAEVAKPVTKYTEFNTNTNINIISHNIKVQLATYFNVGSNNINIGKFSIKNACKMSVRIKVRCNTTRREAVDIIKNFKCEKLENMGVTSHIDRGTIGLGELKLTFNVGIKTDGEFNKGQQEDLNGMKVKYSGTNIQYIELGDTLQHPRLGKIRIVDIKPQNRKLPFIVKVEYKSSQYKLSATDISRLVTEEHITDAKLNMLGL